MLRACSVKGIGVLLLVLAILLYSTLLLSVSVTHTRRAVHAAIDGISILVLLWVLGILGQQAPTYPSADSAAITTLATCMSYFFF